MLFIMFPLLNLFDYGTFKHTKNKPHLVLAALSTDGACPGATSWQKSGLNFHQSSWDLGGLAIQLQASQHCSRSVKKLVCKARAGV